MSSSVLLLTELFPPVVGGSAVLLDEIYSRVVSASVTVMSNARATGAGYRGYRSVLQVPIDGRLRGMRERGAIPQYLRLGRYVRAVAKELDAPVVHCARPLPEGTVGALVQTFTGIPFVCWCHGEEAAAALRSREHGMVLRWVFRRAKRVIASSHNTARLLEAIGVGPERVAVVHPGVDVTRYCPEAAHASTEALMGHEADVRLLTVGRLQARKGHDTVIRALATLRVELPGARYYIVGDGVERARLERLAVELDLVDRVHFLGEVEGDVLPAVYASSSIFVMPNRTEDGDFEGFGIVFLEAAAAGLPVIAGDSGGAPEAVQDGATGLVVDGGSVSDLCEAIRRLALSQQERREMGARGRERVRDLFSWDRAARRLEEIQEQVIRGRYGQ